jgi:FkbM family methyltransferase
MRKELFYNPRLLMERLAEYSLEQRRKSRLKNTVAVQLSTDYIDSLELLELIPPHTVKTVYDIGANIGTWSLLAAAVLQPTQIIAFEPLPLFHERFYQYTKNLPIQLHKVALGAVANKLTMNVASDSSSLLPLGELQNSYFGVNKHSEMEVDVVNLTEYVQAKQLPPPDLIKLDIQGYELEALKGSIGLLKATKYILCEVSFVEFYVGQPLYHDIAHFLAQYGFYTMAVKRTTHTGTRLYQTDVLFEKR